MKTHDKPESRRTATGAPCRQVARHCAHWGKSRWRAKRGGTVYVLILSIAGLLTIIGMTAMYVSRVQVKAAKDSGDWQEASGLASSGVQFALTKIATVPTWRTTYTSGTINGPVTLGRGTFEWKLVDEVDGNLGNSLTDPVRVYATGRVGGTVRIMSAQVKPVTMPIAALQTCLHAGTGMQITSGDWLTPTGAPASTNADASISGSLYGDLAAASKSGTGMVTGQVTVPAPTKPLPAATVFTDYVAKARALTFHGNIDRMVIATGVNEYGGGTNADGLYYISTGGSDITIKDSRLLGTLVINAPGRTVTIDNTVLMEHYRQDYPLLIVKGNLNIKCNSRFAGSLPYLMETNLFHNFNPSGAPFNGSTDYSSWDSYTSGIHGFIHVTGDVTFNSDTELDGTVLCEGFARIYNNTTIDYDGSIMSTPPQGYTTNSSAIAADPTTWRWEVNP